MPVVMVRAWVFWADDFGEMLCVRLLGVNDLETLALGLATPNADRSGLQPSVLLFGILTQACGLGWYKTGLWP